MLRMRSCVDPPVFSRNVVGIGHRHRSTSPHGKDGPALLNLGYQVKLKRAGAAVAIRLLFER